MSYIETTEEYGIININSPTHGHFKVLINLEDVVKCDEITWCILKSVSGKDKEYIEYYATSAKVGLLHRFIMDATEKSQVVDHKNGDTMNNRKYNLRKCSSSENSMNQKKRKSKSGIRGVIWHENSNSWMAYMKMNNKFKNLGYYHDVEDAIKARKLAEETYFGEYMRQDNTYNL